MTIILLVILGVYALSLLFMLVWGFVTSLADYTTFEGMRANKDAFWPSIFRFNYKDMYDLFKVHTDATATGPEKWVYIEEMFFNSVLYALGSTLIKTFVTLIAAYACSRFTYKFSKVVYTIVIVAMILPIVGSLPSELQMAQSLHIYDSIPGIWVMKANFLGMYFLVFYAFFNSLPKAYTEAAKIDGASNLRIMFRVHFPLVTGLFTSVALIDFVNFWNDFQTPLAFLDHYPTVSTALLKILNGAESWQTPAMQMCATFIVIIPTLVIFIIFQKRLMGNLTVGGIKG